MNEYEEPPVTVGSDTPRALSSDCRGEFELMSPSFTSCKVHFRTSYTVRVIGRVIRRLRVRQSRGAESQRIHVHARAILQKLVAAMSYNRITRQPPVSAFTPAPPPPTELGVYRTLFSRAGVYVSPLCLDAMSIGGKWNNFIGSMYVTLRTTKMKHQKNSLENERKKWVARSDIHCYQGAFGFYDCQHTVITPYFDWEQYKALYKRANPSAMQKVQFMGNNTKNSIKCSVEDSSKKLRTTYIYLFYVHRWDWDTSIEEVMDGLHDLVVQGKVLYLVYIQFWYPVSA
ncbi:putative aryl-alcohol dehydrogenase [Moniliophthora roreri MCA 2997]|uniref:Aryl-alcohol dehydrogenase n=1 Tax=Moniliophthora roreri (strain MCA 2997) TaxID=1381753 RepID=V2WJQ1_MONRO|nr:putative aryl-alcohol dehydrogenase [Moniliophthora roreri MCA 2997]